MRYPMNANRIGATKKTADRRQEGPKKETAHRRVAGMIQNTSSAATAGPQVRSLISSGSGKAFQLSVWTSRHQKNGQESAQART